MRSHYLTKWESHQIENLYSPFKPDPSNTDRRYEMLAKEKPPISTRKNWRIHSPRLGEEIEDWIQPLWRYASKREFARSPGYFRDPNRSKSKRWKYSFIARNPESQDQSQVDIENWFHTNGDDSFERFNSPMATAVRGFVQLDNEEEFAVKPVVRSAQKAMNHWLQVHDKVVLRDSNSKTLQKAWSGSWLTIVRWEIKKIYFDVDKEEALQDPPWVEPILNKYLKKLRAD